MVPIGFADFHRQQDVPGDRRKGKPGVFPTRERYPSRLGRPSISRGHAGAVYGSSQESMGKGELRPSWGRHDRPTKAGPGHGGRDDRFGRRRDAQGASGALEYDTGFPALFLYAEFIETEVLAGPRRNGKVTFTTDPEAADRDGAAVSGSACAYEAWSTRSGTTREFFLFGHGRQSAVRL